MLRFLTACVAVLLFFGSASAQPATADAYVWASACKDCHSAQFAAWQKTKHATAIGRLSATERAADCVRCHITGSPPLMEDGLNAGIQCEGCHGAGKAHVQAAREGAAKPGAITRRPAEATCVTCHSETSPHFKFFSYSALAPLVHPGTK